MNKENNNIVVNLKYPITKGERTITSLILPKRVLVKHIMAGDNYKAGSVEREIAILSAMTGESDIILKEMEATDWVLVQAKVQTLFDSEVEDSDPTAENKKK